MDQITSETPTFEMAMQMAIAILGSESKLAKAAGVPQSSLWHARNKNRRPSPRMAKAIERVTNGVVRKSWLRPDIWDPTD